MWPTDPSSQVRSRSSLDARRGPGHRVVRSGDDDHLVVQEGGAELTGPTPAGRGPSATSTAAGPQQSRGSLGPCTSAPRRGPRPGGEEIEQPGRGVLGEHAGGGHPQQPPARPGLADLQHGAVLQPQ